VWEMGMFYHRPYFMRNQESPKTMQIEGLPPEVLRSYNLEIETGQKTKYGWRLKDEQQSYGLWEYTGDGKILDTALQWQNYTREQGFTGFLPLYQTKEGKNYLKRGKNYYYLTDWPNGSSFEPYKSDHLSEVAKKLSELHFYSKSFKIPVPQQGAELEFFWLKAKQQKLTELLAYYQSLKGKRLTNDYERLYVENFGEFYNRGQEALQKMVLAGFERESPAEAHILVGNLCEENLCKTAAGIVILNTTHWQKGAKILDLTLLLSMYLPLKQWEWELGREILVKYQQKISLCTKEKLLLLAQLSFPRRFWVYTYQYLHGKEDIFQLTEKFKQYLYEMIYCQNKCLKKLEKWLLGGNTK
jgi:CotS family spore coat protein